MKTIIITTLVVFAFMIGIVSSTFESYIIEEETTQETTQPIDLPGTYTNVLTSYFETSSKKWLEWSWSSISWTISKNGGGVYNLHALQMEESFNVEYVEYDNENKKYVYFPKNNVKLDNQYVLSVHSSQKLSDCADGNITTCEFIIIMNTVPTFDKEFTFIKYRIEK